MWTFVGSKAHKVWLWLAVERANRRIVAWVLGDPKRAALLLNQVTAIGAFFLVNRSYFFLSDRLLRTIHEEIIYRKMLQQGPI
jgi:IS1 family transposase